MSNEPTPARRIPVLHPITRLIVGGAQENTMYTAAMLDPERFEASVLAGTQVGTEGSLIEEVRARNVPLTLLPSLVREVSPPRDLKALWERYRHFRRTRPTIVHTHSSKAGFLGRLAAHWARVPVVIHTVHGWSFHDHMSARSRALNIRLEKMVAPYSDALIVVTGRDIEKGLREGIGREEQYTVIRSAIPLEEFDPARYDRAAIRAELGIPAEVPVLGNVGRLSPQKNPLDWVRVAAGVAREVPDCWFLLVGDGPLRPEVEDALREAGLAERAVLPGLRRDVPRMLAAMDAFLLTSLWEGLPRVIPQAMSMEVPVVATGADGSSEAVTHGETGYLARPGEIEAMAGHVVRLLTDEAHRREMGNRGRQHAQKEFDVRVMVRQIEELYERVMREKGIG